MTHGQISKQRDAKDSADQNKSNEQYLTNKLKFAKQQNMIVVFLLNYGFVLLSHLLWMTQLHC